MVFWPVFERTLWETAMKMGPCCLHRHSDEHGPLKRCYRAMTLHGVNSELDFERIYQVNNISSLSKN